MGGGISKHQDETKADFSSPPAPSVDSNNATPKKEGGEEESKCPMHNKDGSYSYDWKQMFKAAAVHGPKGSKPLSQEEQDKAKALSQPSETSGGGGCPVKHSPVPSSGESSGCPVKHGSSSAIQHPEYNVYSQPIDKTNQMPTGVRTQMPTATQKAEISTDRVKSTIPKGGNAENSSTWTYPSPQQFYNALARKGKLDDDTSEADMESVVALHNNMNEKTWAQVVEWEKQTYGSSSTPKLLKFQGRPHDLSPKATLKHYLLGHPLPYDRHDWTVLRDDGSTVRYVIDYYYDDTRAKETEESAKPALHDRTATSSLLVDVRPALDGASQFVARAVQMPYKIWNQETSFQPLPLKGTPEMDKQVQESLLVWQSIQQARKQELQQEEASMEISQSEAQQIALNFAKVLKGCRKQQARVKSCKSEEDCTRASVDLTMCMGPLLCPVQHKNLKKTLAEGSDDKIEGALETLTECVILQTAQRAVAKNQHPAVFKD
jgi:hypothetical protein